MLRKKQMADIIDTVRKGPVYLVSRNWLCTIIHDQRELLGLSNEDVRQLLRKIGKSLGGSSFLRVHLMNRKLIREGCAYSSKEYHKAAHAHWDKLVAKLRE